MNKKIFVVSLAFAAASVAGSMQAQNAKGALTPKVLEEIRSSYAGTPADRALRNAVIANGMTFTNSAKTDFPDAQFSHRVQSKGISDQHQSGRCWLFTGMNVLRSRMITDNNMDSFFFSHNYSFFWDQLEKSNLFLQGIIDTRNKPIDDKMVEWLFKNPIGDGGQYTGVSENLMKYGLVPAEVMPETRNSNNTTSLNRILSKVLRQGGMRLRQATEKGAGEAKLEARKKDILKRVYRLLVMNLGEPPTEFTWSMRDASGKVISTQKYTPQSFFKQFVHEDMREDYVMVMNDPSRPYYKLFEIDYDRHNYDGKNWTYVNVPMEDLKQMAIASIKDSTMMYYSCDVGKELDRTRGILAMDNNDYASLLGEEFTLNKKERIQTFDSGSTHAMTLMAVDLDATGKPTKWMVENSWGANNGAQGHLIITDEWFDAYTFRLVVNKRYVPAKVLDILKTTPIRLPAWDPMFAPEQ